MKHLFVRRTTGWIGWVGRRMGAAGRRASILLVLAALASPAQAQIPGGQIPSEAEMRRLLQQNPEAIRQRLLQSGMTEAEIRAQLRARGIPSDALDRYLQQGVVLDTTSAVNPEAGRALRGLGIVRDTPDGIELIPLDTGMVVGDGDRPRGLGIFGLDTFTRATTRFQPLLSGPVPDSYRIGPGDQMVLVLTGEVELAHELVVTREGFIVIPNVGQISVGNLSMGDLRTVLRQRLARSYSGVERGTTSFSVSISELRANQIYVAGEVAQPGAYQLSSVATVMNALYAAGGPTSTGNMRSIEVRRRTGERHTLDLYPYLLSGDISGDVILEQGDVVFVPLRGRRVELTGAVTRPNRYELAENDGLAEVLRAAGGFAPEARRNRLTIHRILRPADRGSSLALREAIDLELRPSTDTTAASQVGGVLLPPVGLQDGDSIVVDSVPPLERGLYVNVAGMVQRGGRFPWREGMTIRDVIALARGPRVGADLREAEVARMPSDRDAGVVATTLRVPLDSSYLSLGDFDPGFRGPPGLAFPRPGASPEFRLEPFDQVLLLPQPGFELPQQVRIEGEVAQPGTYTLLRKDERVADLVARAGGLLPSGYPEGARLIRDQGGLGRINLDLPAALANAGEPANILLVAGDSLFIPEFSPTVRVRGAVNSPVTVMWQEGRGLDYYIANAGGYRSDADKGAVSVRYADGSARTRSRFLFFSSYPEPGPGGEILVPSRDPTNRTDWAVLLGPIVSGLGTVAALIIAVTR